MERRVGVGMVGVEKLQLEAVGSLGRKVLAIMWVGDGEGTGGSRESAVALMRKTTGELLGHELVGRLVHVVHVTTVHMRGSAWRGRAQGYVRRRRVAPHGLVVHRNSDRHLKKDIQETTL